MIKGASFVFIVLALILGLALCEFDAANGQPADLVRVVDMEGPPSYVVPVDLDGLREPINRGILVHAALNITNAVKRLDRFRPADLKGDDGLPCNEHDGAWPTRDPKFE